MLFRSSVHARINPFHLCRTAVGASASARARADADARPERGDAADGTPQRSRDQRVRDPDDAPGTGVRFDGTTPP